MTQEEKSLLLKDLCARLPYCVLVIIIDKKSINPNNICKLVGIDLDIGSYSFVDTNNYTIEIGTKGFKPYLRPMSSMTEEEKDHFNYLVSLGFTGISTNSKDNIIDWLNSHHFDYRGLIEKGLALEALEGMYK